MLRQPCSPHAIPTATSRNPTRRGRLTCAEVGGGDAWVRRCAGAILQCARVWCGEVSFKHRLAETSRCATHVSWNCGMRMRTASFAAFEQDGEFAEKCLLRLRHNGRAYIHG